MKKTYAESQGKKSFNWNEFLNKDQYTEEELKEASRLSKDWVTCAVGNQCHIIPRDFMGTPKDKRLATLGWAFHGKIAHMIEPYSRDVWKRHAIQILKIIEQRSAELIKEIEDASTN